jgi:hypothetical protein
MKQILLGLLALFTLHGGTVMAVEEPDYRTAFAQEPFEVREYPALIVAEVAVSGERKEAVSAGFRLLAGYIFGGNTRRQSIAMTAPVVQAPQVSETIAMTAPVIQAPDSAGWTIRFTMPRGYTLETLPIPDDPRVRLKSIPPARFAVIRFSGLAGEADIEENTTALNDFVAAHALPVAGPALLARYNPPWTPWFLRRNEMMIPLREAP